MINAISQAIDSSGDEDGAAPACRAEKITKAYGDGGARVTALDEVTLDIPRGRFTAVMGPSGSGKSTLMHCLAGLDSVDSGRIYVGNVEVTGLNDRKLTYLRRDKIGFIFQSFNLIPTLTALENITLPMDIAGQAVDREWLDRIVRAVNLGDRLSHRPSQLSGGQQQRVACARALASKPEIIFADEPTGNLDSRTGADVLAFLKESVGSFGQTIVMVTHDPVAASYSDAVVFLADGRVVDTLREPTAALVLDRMKGFDVAMSGAHPSTGAANR